MTSLKLISVLTLSALFFFSSCERHSMCIKGNNKSRTRTIETNDFNKVELDGSFNLTITQGDDLEVKVTGDENIISDFDANVKNNTCKLSLKDGCYKNYDLSVAITMPHIEAAFLDGSGNIRINDFYNQSSFYGEITGSGNMNLHVIEGVSTLDFRIDGSGNIKCNSLVTEVENSEVIINGSGDYYGFPIEAKNVYARISGSGNVRVTALNNLEAIIDGSGDIKYKGYPSLTQKITGSGDITHVD
ncbi:MAG: DUF2807 domain-containing protein [Bacteroidia bacterium]|nr:DUF2807 domain-containing protein [Bacteroidia bacterium]